MIETPCQTGNPDDWFIEADGRQYPEDPILSEDELTTALRQRRHAREACLNDCPARRACLSYAIEGRPMYGIHGGYYPHELRAMYEHIDARKARSSN